MASNLLPPRFKLHINNNNNNNNNNNSNNNNNNNNNTLFIEDINR